MGRLVLTYRGSLRLPVLGSVHLRFHAWDRKPIHAIPFSKYKTSIFKEFFQKWSKSAKIAILALFCKIDPLPKCVEQWFDTHSTSRPQVSRGYSIRFDFYFNLQEIQPFRVFDPPQFTAKIGILRRKIWFSKKPYKTSFKVGFFAQYRLKIKKYALRYFWLT